MQKSEDGFAADKFPRTPEFLEMATQADHTYHF
ncbi:hypothetical protein GA0116948_105196 [Chitinophaga costaii]|uniref:Uncharacterized protein n=1 Tax=Chitinophaga costaii TaxID=1335309 RepID=A0A1C4DC51_9BACT|nr:hypothetical protein GA0116948_105196 [Chitinophaga costaii]